MSEDALPNKRCRVQLAWFLNEMNLCFLGCAPLCAFVWCNDIFRLLVFLGRGLTDADNEFCSEFYKYFTCNEKSDQSVEDLIAAIKQYHAEQGGGGGGGGGGGAQ